MICVRGLFFDLGSSIPGMSCSGMTLGKTRRVALLEWARERGMTGEWVFKDSLSLGLAALPAAAAGL